MNTVIIVVVIASVLGMIVMMFRYGNHIHNMGKGPNKEQPGDKENKPPESNGND